MPIGSEVRKAEPTADVGIGVESVMPEANEITQLLHAMRDGDRSAFDRLLPLVYSELRRIARGRIRRSAKGWTLDTTGLVHEAYLKMAGQASWNLQDRAEFMAASSVAMKQVIIQFARARMAAKRGGGNVASVQFDETRIGIDEQAERLLALDEALERLRERNERLARVVECRFFAGLSEEETAKALAVSLRTVQRDWMRARAWLHEDLRSGGG